MSSAMPKGLEGAADDFAGQERYFEKVRAVTYATLLAAARELLAGDNPLVRELGAAWADRSFSASYDRPLLFCYVLRWLAMHDARHPLRGILDDSADGQCTVDADQLLSAWQASPGAVRLLGSRRVQTNEVSRAIAWILPASIALAPGTPLVLVDIGCSAGLNLIADLLDLSWQDDTGRVLELRRPGNILGRLGLDQNPLEPSLADDADWLRACVWPGQAERLRQLNAAIETAAAFRQRGELVIRQTSCLSAPSILREIRAAHPAASILAYQTVLRDYLDADLREAHERGMREWVLESDGQGLWCELESHGERGPRPAEIRLTIATSGELRQHHLARTEWHPATLALHAPLATATPKGQSS
jgi:hypothetical protein